MMQMMLIRTTSKRMFLCTLCARGSGEEGGVPRGGPVACLGSVVIAHVPQSESVPLEEEIEANSNPFLR